MTGRLLIFAAAMIVLAGCVGRISHHPLPAGLAYEGQVAGFEGIRFYGDEAPREPDSGIADLKARLAAKRAEGAPSFDILALSGGSEDGAFGAGFLVGWSGQGTRPAFDIVTGISTGGLSAPFAFLGPEYDATLREIYTTTTRKDIYKSCILCGLAGTAFSKTKPLKRLIKKHYTAEVLAAIAAEHAKGRRLWIGTTNLETGRPVIWDIGALAASNRPDALALFHKILLATAAVPGFFPPVAIPVVAGGQSFTELHVDGGAAFVAFLYPPGTIAGGELDEAGAIARNLYVILNLRHPPAFEATKARSFSIVERALEITVRYKAVGDALRIYEIARRDGLDFRLILIPQSFTLTPEREFDTAYMAALFAVGLDAARADDPWLKAPPGFEAVDVE